MVAPQVVIGGLSLASSVISNILQRKDEKKAINKQGKLYNEVRQGLTGGGGAFEQFGPLDETQFRDQFEKGIMEPALRKFREETIPSVFDQFSSMGLEGSGAFQDALGKATSDFQLGQEELYTRSLMQEQSGRAGRASNLLNQMLGIQQPVQQNAFSGPLAAFGNQGAIASGRGYGGIEDIGSLSDLVKAYFATQGQEPKAKPMLTNPDNREAQVNG